jgi:hypothetical protein
VSDRDLSELEPVSDRDRLVDPRSLGGRDLRGEGLTEFRPWGDNVVGAGQPVVRGGVRILDDAHDRHVRGDLLCGEDDARVDPIGDVREQRTGRRQVGGVEPRGRLRISPDHVLSVLVQLARPLPVGFDEHVRDAVGVEFTDELLCSRRVRADDDVVFQGRLGLPRDAGGQHRLDERPHEHRKGTDQEQHPQQVGHGDEQIHLGALPRRVAAEPGRGEHLDGELDGFEERPRSPLVRPHPPLVSERGRDERRDDENGVSGGAAFPLFDACEHRDPL